MNLSYSILWERAGGDEDKIVDLSRKWRNAAGGYYHEKFEENRVLSRTEVWKITKEFFPEITRGKLKSMWYRRKKKEE